MVKSRTTKKSKTPQQIARQVEAKTAEKAANIVASYVKVWAKAEVNRIIATNTVPVIAPIKHGYRVNRQRVIKQSNETWRLVNDFDELVHVFYDKRSAIIYSVLYQLHRFVSADQLLMADARLNKLQADFQHYDNSMRRAAKRRDYAAVDVLSSRYYDTKEMLICARNELEKTLRSNKYLKVWDIGKPL